MSVLPNFIIGGAAKAGTTSLCHYLNQHPEIFISPEKEPRYFTPEMFTRDLSGPLRAGARRDPPSLESYLALFSGVIAETAIGEASTEYLYYPQAPCRIHKLLPEAKLIFVLRNPVDRAFSAYCYQRRDGCESLSFQAAIAREDFRFQNCWRPGWLYVRSGFYYEQLKRYFDFFPAENIRIYRYEQLSKNPLSLCQDIFGFLGVNYEFEPNVVERKNVSYLLKYPAFVQSLRRNSAALAAKSALLSCFSGSVRTSLPETFRTLFYAPKPKLSPELRKNLIGLFEPDIKQLEQLTNTDFSDWYGH